MNPRLDLIAERFSFTGQCRDAMHRRRGSVAVMAAIFLSIVIILFSSIDIGYMFYMKRNLQKAADLAALAGTQQLVSTPLNGNPTTCAASDGPVLAAIGNARTNGFSTAAPNTMVNTITVTCGRWDPVANASSAPSYFAPPIAGAALNSVRVLLTQNVPAFFGLGTRTLSAQAIGSASDPYAAFSVGSKLLQINNGPVEGLLASLGLNITGTRLLSYSGLANVSVTPGGLLQALGFQIPLHADIGTVTNILQLNTAGCSNGMCTLEALLGAMTTVGGQQDLINVLGLTVQQLSVRIPILSDQTGQGGIFALINAPDAQSALNVNLNALTVLNTMLAVANNKNFATVPPAQAISIPGVLTVTTQIGLVEPPSIAIGGLPTTPGGAKTTAYNSQVRLYAHIQSNLLNLNLVKIDMPIFVDVVNGYGSLTGMCTGKLNGQDYATINVQAPILSLCAGSINNVVDDTLANIASHSSTMLNTAFSTKNVCKTNLTNWPMLSVLPLLGSPLSINTKVALDALQNSSDVSLNKGQTVTTPSNPLQIGTTLSALLAALLGSISILPSTSGVTNSTLAAGLLNGISGGSTGVLTYTNSISQGLQNFLTTLPSAVQGLLNGALSLNILGMLSSLGTLVNGLLGTLSNILGSLIGFCGVIGHNSQNCVANSLTGSQSGSGQSISNVLLAVLGIVLNLLQPVLNSLGTAISSLLQNLLGIQLGGVDVTLLDLNCGGTTVNLVY
ncbi:pilus assembly protein TadG-related protein [Collimonas pratensis]|uniref:TadE-like family protein n=1 Tax=Collimonas pratensis TaxID=279113 RepID=A0ABN4M6M3_9BURK|nr:pilus assembly protein TadG-related protein [Collimonas pratensis]AMP13205.1 tadE-like family protein [Collimonas pratensis]